MEERRNYPRSKAYHLICEHGGGSVMAGACMAAEGTGSLSSLMI